ncbi:SGNH/GDSL hydrolase family protein [Roseateles sp.]|uniref:SGNH/GDSL hydrolase family protein n=1 Tax=Roseateles sp. TaxID=1971397 RepID=UPI0025F962BD|nr:SGNH/GDSL hydrolase family protein [Roseateles sp.]MBV8037024.1 SGNH/GDSL hydrolase family protein [Roseateles sp.]
MSSIVSRTGWIRSALVKVALALCLPAAHAVPSFSTIYVFGDSLSDTGNTQAVLGTNAIIANTAGYGANGRFSNGPVWHESLATGLGLAPATRSRSNGNNYAHGGARIDNASGQSAGVLNQYASYTSGKGAGGADANALYIVWGGGNDARDLVGKANPLSAIQSAIGSLSGVLTGLLNSGATTLLVPNLPDLGRIPEFRTGANASSASQVSKLWNDTLLTMLDEINSHTTASIYFLDVFSIFNDVLDHPASYGFSNTTGQCRSLGFLNLTEISCANADSWVFWDQIHPTKAAHAMLGAAALDLLSNGSPLAHVPEPASVMLVLLALALAAAISRPRRGAAQDGLPLPAPALA